METNTIFLIGAIAFGIIAIHPFTTFPLSLLLVRRLMGKSQVAVSAVQENQNPSFGICVCAYNEQGGIRAKLENLKTLKKSYPGPVEIYVYDDCSADDTLAILQEYSDQFTIANGTSRKGKSAGMNELMSRCNEELVVFSDANVRIDEQALDVFATYFKNPKIGCICGTLIYEDVDRKVAAQTSSLYWRLEEAIKQLESDTGSAMGADGALFAIRRSLFREVPVDIIDDMFTSMSILCDGYEIKKAPEALAFERAAQESSEEFRRKKRIACRCINCVRLLRPRLARLSLWNQYKFISHKMIRWTAVLWLALSLLLFLCFLVTQFGAGFAAGFALLTAVAFGVGSRFGWPGIRHIIEILSSFVAAGIGVFQSLSGERYQTWQPATSAHQHTESTVTG